MLLGIRLGIPMLGAGRPGGGGPVGAPPLNYVLPSIEGTPIAGLSVTFRLGLWAGTVTQFEIEVRTADLATVLLARQIVTADTTGTVPDTEGEEIVLRVWATGPGGTVLASSAAFGPIAPASDFTWLQGFVMYSDQSLAALAFPHINLGATTQTTADNLYSSGATYDGTNRYGYEGSIPGNGLMTASTGADPRLRSRMSSNQSPTQLSLRVDLPGGAVTGRVIRMWAGMGRSSSGLSGNIAVFDGAPTATPNPDARYRVEAIAMDSANRWRDATGADYPTEAAWRDADLGDGVEAGVPAEFVINSSYLSVTRDSTTPQTNYLAFAVVNP